MRVASPISEWRECSFIAESALCQVFGRCLSLSAMPCHLGSPPSADLCGSASRGLQSSKQVRELTD